jgi:hypothetical protein
MESDDDRGRCDDPARSGWFADFLDAMVARTRSFSGWQSAEAFYREPDGPGGPPCRCTDLADLVRSCRERTIAWSIYVFAFESEMATGTTLVSLIAPRGRIHLLLLSEAEGDYERYLVREPDLAEFQRQFEGIVRLPDWAFLSALLADPARN